LFAVFVSDALPSVAMIGPGVRVAASPALIFMKRFRPGTIVPT